MPSIILTKEEVKEIVFEDYDENTLEVVEDNDWIDDGKYSFKDIIFKKGNKFYRLEVSRSGDYYSDYYYCWEDEDEFECNEVEKKEVVVTKWFNVKGE